MQPTMLQVVLPVPDLAAVLRIGDGQQFVTLAFQGTRAATSLPVGDYVVTLDASHAASPSAPYRVTTSVDAIFMTAGPPDGDGMRSLVAGVGRTETTNDPKDPWPPPVVAGGTPAETSFLAASPIGPAMR